MATAPAAAMDRRSTVPGNLARAWSVVRDDPAGILLPAGALLVVQVVAAMATQRAWRQGGPEALAAALVAAACVRMLIGAPLRALMLTAGARAMGIRARPRWLPLLGVQLVVGPLQLLVAAGCLTAGTLSGALVAGHGWYTTAALLGFSGVAAATLGALLVRALFAYAPVEVVAGGRSGTGALWASLQRGPWEVLPALLLLGVGDLIVGTGALLCGAGALPGYPLSDLALMDRWQARAGGTR